MNFNKFLNEWNDYVIEFSRHCSGTYRLSLMETHDGFQLRAYYCGQIVRVGIATRKFIDEPEKTRQLINRFIVEREEIWNSPLFKVMSEPE